MLKEITEAGGEAMICEARLIDGLTDDEVKAQFNAVRELAYENLAKEARVMPVRLGLLRVAEHSSVAAVYGRRILAVSSAG